jgi:hypothetical protein
MNEKRLPRLRLYATALAVLAELAHLAWEYFNGGVKSHHILNLPEMPAISNWWGLFLLPVLTWYLTGRIQKSIVSHDIGKDEISKLPLRVIAGFIGSLFHGILLSISFTNGNETIASYLFLGMFVLALLLPVYRAEFVLGFVLGMTFTFGVVLPTAVGSIIATLSAFIHLGVRPIVIRLWANLKRT